MNGCVIRRGFYDWMIPDEGYVPLIRIRFLQSKIMAHYVLLFAYCINPPRRHTYDIKDSRGASVRWSFRRRKEMEFVNGFQSQKNKKSPLH
jgi:hypothetical protein